MEHRTGKWTNLRSPDGAEPHSDDRNYAWDPSGGGRLVIVTDGGVSVRDEPRSDKGQWRSANGDMGTMEMLAASYDPMCAPDAQLSRTRLPSCPLLGSYGARASSARLPPAPRGGIGS